jgi:hypothetical protein
LAVAATRPKRQRAPKTQNAGGLQIFDIDRGAVGLRRIGRPITDGLTLEQRAEQAEPPSNSLIAHEPTNPLPNPHLQPANVHAAAAAAQVSDDINTGLSRDEIGAQYQPGRRKNTNGLKKSESIHER